MQFSYQKFEYVLLVCNYFCEVGLLVIHPSSIRQLLGIAKHIILKKTVSLNILKYEMADLI
jgi:hypothetical protein